MRSRSVFTLAFLAVVAGCESGDPVTPQVDVDAALTQMATGSISGYNEVATGLPISPPTPNSTSCAFDATSAFFVCAPVTSSGMTFSRRFQLLDAAGAPLSTRDPLRVAAIRSVIDLEGTTTTPAPDPVTIQLARHEDATLSGIQSTNRVMQANATQALSLAAEGASVTLNDTSVTTNLRLPYTAEQKYPLGGSIVTNGTFAFVSDGVTGSSHVHTEITFDGTSIMTVKATYGSETVTCKIDMGPSGKSTCA